MSHLLSSKKHHFQPAIVQKMSFIIIYAINDAFDTHYDIHSENNPEGMN